MCLQIGSFSTLDTFLDIISLQKPSEKEENHQIIEVMTYAESWTIAEHSTKVNSTNP